MDATTLIEQFTTTSGELSLDLLDLAHKILAAGTAASWHRPDDEAHLRAVRLTERIARATEHTRIRVVADADAAKAAKAERTYLADIIASETKDTPRRATNAVFAARDISQFPLVLAAFADARIGRGHIPHAVKALATVQPFFDDEPFEALTRDLLQRAAITDPQSFKTDCERLMADVDELSKKSQEALAAIKQERSAADRAMILTPRDRNHPEFGTDVAMHLTGADTSILTPVIDRIAESIRRRRLNAGKDPKPLKERRIEALIELARRFGDPKRRTSNPRTPSPSGTTAPSDAFPDSFDELFALEGNLEDAPDFVKEAIAMADDELPSQPAPPAAETNPTTGTRLAVDPRSADAPRPADEPRLAVGEIREHVRKRDGGCVYPGCDIPFVRCIVHHIVPFAAGGTTTLDNLCALCETHHAQVENPPNSRDFSTMRMSDDGVPEFIPPISRDPLQRPVRHARFGTTYGLKPHFKRVKRARPKRVGPRSSPGEGPSAAPSADPSAASSTDSRAGPPSDPARSSGDPPST